MRKVHVIMFGSQIIINIVFSLMLFGGFGLLEAGGEIFAFIYPLFVFVYLLVDMFLTIFTTDLFVRAFKNKKACVLSIVLRDLLIIVFWWYFLLYIGMSTLTLWGTLFYAFPKIIKIIICDLVNKQKYLQEYIEI